MQVAPDGCAPALHPEMVMGQVNTGGTLMVPMLHFTTRLYCVWMSPATDNEAHVIKEDVMLTVEVDPVTAPPLRYALQVRDGPMYRWVVIWLETVRQKVGSRKKTRR
jgi:hypothetical protein